MLGEPDRSERSARDEFLKLKALIEAADHVVHAASQVADLVLRPGAVDALPKVALCDLDGDAAHLEDRAADGEREQDGP